MPFFARRKLTDSYDQAVHIREVDLETEKSLDYYCPCEKCSCRLRIRKGRNEDGRTHFFKLPSDEHSKDCWMPSGKEKEAESLTADNLVLEQLFDSLNKETRNNTNQGTSQVSATGKSKSTEIKTVRQLYLFCTHHPDSEIIGCNQPGSTPITVRDIFVGRKTRYFYKYFFYGLKLVEAEYLSYSAKSNSIFFIYPFSAAPDESTITFKLRIPKKALFEKVVSEIEGETRPILIFTRWYKSGDDIYGYIEKRRLLHVFTGKKENASE